MIYQILPRYDYKFNSDSMGMFLKTLSSVTQKKGIKARLKSFLDNQLLDFAYIIDCDEKGKISFFMESNESNSDLVINSLENMFQEQADVFEYKNQLEKHEAFQTLYTVDEVINNTSSSKVEKKSLASYADDQIFLFILGSLKKRTRIKLEFNVNKSFEIKSKFSFRGSSTDVLVDVMIKVSGKTKYQRNELMEITNTIINLTSAQKQMRVLYKDAYKISTITGNELLNLLQLPTFYMKPADLQILQRIYKLETGQRTIRTEEFSRGIKIGHVYHPMQNRDVYLSETQMRKHMFITGQTGSGKSSVAEEMMRDILTRKASGEKKVPGFTLFDPAETSALGVIDMALKIESDGKDISMLKEQIHYIDFGFEECVFPISILNKDVPSTEILDYFKTLYGDSLTIQVDRMMTSAINALLLDDVEHTIMDVPKLFRDEKMREDLQVKLADNIYAADSIAFLKSKFNPNVVDPILNRTDPFLNTAQKKLMFGMTSEHDGLRNFRKWIDNGDIILFNLKGLNDFDRKIILGYISLKYYLIGLQRNDNSLLHITFMDEAHKTQFEVLQRWLAELRKSGMAICPLTQYLEQFNMDYLKSLLGNVGTKISFRQGEDAARRLVPNLVGNVDKEGLKRLPDCIGYVSTEDNGVMKSILVQVDPPYRYNDGKAVPHPDPGEVQTKRNNTKNRKLAREFMSRDFISRKNAEEIVFHKHMAIEESLKLEEELLEEGDALWDE